MRLTKQALKRIIKEETRRLISEIGPPEHKAFDLDFDAADRVDRAAPRHGRPSEREYSDEPVGKNKVYVLDRGRDYEGRTVVGVYSSEELAKKGIESDIEAWRASGRLSQLPSPEEYDIQEFELDD